MNGWIRPWNFRAARCCLPGDERSFVELHYEANNRQVFAVRSGKINSSCGTSGWPSNVSDDRNQDRASGRVHRT